MMIQLYLGLSRFMVKVMVFFALRIHLDTAMITARLRFEMFVRTFNKPSSVMMSI